MDSKKAVFSTWYELFPRSTGTGSHGTFRDCERRLPEIAAMGFDILYLPPIHPIGFTNRKGRNNTTVSEEGDPGSPWAIGSSFGGHKDIEPQLGSMEDLGLINAAASYRIEAMDMLQCSRSPLWRNIRNGSRHGPMEASSMGESSQVVMR